MSTLPRDVLSRAFNGDARAIGAFEQLDAHLNAKAAEVAQLLEQAEDTTNRLTTLEGANNQEHSSLLDAIAALPDNSGAIEITGIDDATVRPIDGTDNASLISRGEAQKIFADISTVGVTDGDKGDITVSGSGTVWTIDAGAISAGDVSGLGYFATGTDAANLTGTVAAAHLPAFTGGDVTSSAGSVVLTIGNGAVSLAKMANVATGTVFYRKTAGTGAPEVQTLATLKTDLGLTGTNSGDQTITLTGDITGSGTGSFPTTIGANKVTRAMLAQTSGARLLGATGAGNVADLTGTQATTLLDTFTSALKGIVPASGGGTTNFLRADGSWAAPTAGAAGSSGNVQYNSGGALAGSAMLDIDANGAPRLDAGNAATPGADQAALEIQKVASSGLSGHLRVRSEDGIVMTMQPHLGRNTVFGEAPQGASSTVQSWLCNALTVVGTAGASTISSTNRVTRAKRLLYASAATAGSTAGRYNTNTYVTVGAGGSPPVGGFKAVFRWSVADAATVAGAHMFVGLSSSTSAPVAATSPATLTNLIGVAQVNGSANLQIVYGGSAAQTAIDLGASFPAADTTALYELILYASPSDATKVSYRVENISTGASTSGVLSGTAGTALPASSTMLGPRMWRSNNATAAAVTMVFVTWMIESDI